MRSIRPAGQAREKFFKRQANGLPQVPTTKAGIAAPAENLAAVQGAPSLR